MLRWLDYVPLLPLAIAAGAMALSPPLAEPHLWQKLRLFASGHALRPIDIYDFVLHVSLPVLLLLKWLRMRTRGPSDSE